MLIHAIPFARLSEDGEGLGAWDRRAARYDERARADFAFWDWIEQHGYLPEPGQLPSPHATHAWREWLAAQQTQEEST